MHDTIGLARTYEYQNSLNQDLLRGLAARGTWLTRTPSTTLCRRRCPNCECADCTSCPCDKCKIGRLEQRVAELEGAK